MKMSIFYMLLIFLHRFLQTSLGWGPERNLLNPLKKELTY